MYLESHRCRVASTQDKTKRRYDTTPEKSGRRMGPPHHPSPQFRRRSICRHWCKDEVRAWIGRRDPGDQGWLPWILEASRQCLRFDSFCHHDEKSSRVVAVMMDEEHSAAQREGWKGHHTTSMSANMSCRINRPQVRSDAVKPS